MKSISLGRKGWAIAAGIALLTALGLYLGGRWQERSRAAEAQEALAGRIATLTGERDRAAAALASARVQIALLRARSLLFETALDLERRNFGTANSRLDAAAEQLAAAQRIGGTGELDPLQSQIANTDLRVAADLAEQRARVLGFATRLDQLIGSASAPAQSAREGAPPPGDR